VDWSQQEVGIAAWHSGDKLLKQIFNSGQDVFVQCAKVMFDKTIEKSDPFRDRMKTIVHGADYGMEASGLARKENISIDEAEEMLDRFRKYFPTHARYIEHQRKNKKFVRTAMGRKAWLNPYSGQCERNALNDPIQGGGADMLKKSFATLHQEWNLDYPYPIVEVTHDEIGIDVPEGLVDKASELTRDIMVQTANSMYPGMNFRADITIGNSWAGG
jgi:DNA polymerase-1